MGPSKILKSDENMDLGESNLGDETPSEVENKLLMKIPSLDADRHHKWN